MVYLPYMDTKILNYTVVIEPDQETGTDKPGFTAYCPILGIADDGNTVEQAVAHITRTIEFHLACLSEEGEKIPSSGGFLTSVQVHAPNGYRFAS